MGTALFLQALSIRSESLDRCLVLVSSTVGRVASLVFNLYDCSYESHKA